MQPRKKHFKKVVFRKKLFAKLAEEATMCVENLLNLQKKYLQPVFFIINTILQQ